MYEDYTLIDPGEISDTDEPDVIVDVPIVKVDEIHFELDDLEARVALHAKVLDLVELNVGVMATLGKVELNIKGVEAQALLRAQARPRHRDHRSRPDDAGSQSRAAREHRQVT